MHWIFRALIVIVGNALALWLANLIVPASFVVHADWVQLTIIALVLALLNFLLKPLLTLVLGPIIIITLGLGVIIVNAIILYFLPIIVNHIDFLHGSITIETIPALLLATLVVSIVNFFIHFI